AGARRRAATVPAPRRRGACAGRPPPARARWPRRRRRALADGSAYRTRLHYIAAMSNPIIRAAEARDLPAVVGLVRALADFEKLEGPDDAAARRLADDFAAGRYSLLVADDGERIVGYALFFFTSSTFLARPSLYLEALFVHPGARGRGIG